MSITMPARATPASAQTCQYVTFSIDDHEYGVDIMTVREIKGWTDTTSVPNAPASMRGMLNLRGTIVPIYDLRARFGLGVTGATKTHVVIIVTIGRRTIGLLVDAVSDILTIGADEIRAVPSLDHGSDQRFLAGLVSLERRMVALLSLEHLFDLGPPPSMDGPVSEPMH